MPSAVDRSISVSHPVLELCHSVFFIAPKIQLWHKKRAKSDWWVDVTRRVGDMSAGHVILFSYDKESLTSQVSRY